MYCHTKIKIDDMEIGVRARKPGSQDSYDYDYMIDEDGKCYKPGNTISPTTLHSSMVVGGVTWTILRQKGVTGWSGIGSQSYYPASTILAVENVPGSGCWRGVAEVEHGRKVRAAFKALTTIAENADRYLGVVERKEKEQEENRRQLSRQREEEAEQREKTIATANRKIETWGALAEYVRNQAKRGSEEAFALARHIEGIE